jgi:hypothetical protein
VKNSISDSKFVKIGPPWFANTHMKKEEDYKMIYMKAIKNIILTSFINKGIPSEMVPNGNTSG